jgi:hypothetical protein
MPVLWLAHFGHRSFILDGKNARMEKGNKKPWRKCGK